MDLYGGTIVIRANGSEMTMDVQVRADNYWRAKAAIEAQYGASFLRWWRGPTVAR